MKPPEQAGYRACVTNPPHLPPYLAHLRDAVARRRVEEIDASPGRALASLKPFMDRGCDFDTQGSCA